MRVKAILGPRLQFDRKIVLITVVSTLLLLVDYYYPLTSDKYFDRVILYLFIPLSLTLFLFHENPGEYGLTLGDWKAGILITLAGILVMTPTLSYLGANNPGMAGFYKPLLEGLPWTTFLNLVGWEFIFRVWILFGYARKFGAEALWLQAVPFALVLVGKPDIETLSTIFGGFAFGWVAWRTRSFLYPFLLHWFISTVIILVAAGALG